MTLDEAIERNKYIKSNNVVLMYDKDAVQLGIEALEAIQKDRTWYPQDCIGKLPSETEEK